MQRFALASILHLPLALLLAGASLQAQAPDSTRSSLLEVDRAFDRAAAERGLEGFLTFVHQEATFFGAE